MEIGNKSIHALEFITRIYKYTGIARAFLYLTVGACNAFNRATACSTHAYYSAAVLLGLIYSPCRAFGHIIMLGMHLMLGYVLYLYGAEGAESYMQGDIFNFYAVIFKAFKQLGRKMQTCRRRRRRAEFL